MPDGFVVAWGSAGLNLAAGILSRIEAPTLEDLRNLPDAAWLWDGARGRVVWANSAGVAYFGGESLFDLIDRPFDYAEPGVERIMALSKLLSRGQVETTLLSFPSSGHTAPISCRCTIHTLADGRAGLLVIAASYRDSDSEIPFEKLAQAFDLLPAAAAFMGQDGSLHRLNAAALLLLEADQRASLSALIENSSHADDLLARLSSTGTVSDVKRLRTKIGQRDIRLTLRKLGIAADNVAFAMVLLDDITERRALERNYFNSGTSGSKKIFPPRHNLLPPRRMRFIILAKRSTNRQSCLRLLPRRFRKSPGANRRPFRSRSPMRSTNLPMPF